jgi:hypothetical protein
MAGITPEAVPFITGTPSTAAAAAVVPSIVARAPVVAKPAVASRVAVLSIAVAEAPNRSTGIEELPEVSATLVARAACARVLSAVSVAAGMSAASRPVDSPALEAVVSMEAEVFTVAVVAVARRAFRPRRFQIQNGRAAICGELS